MAKAASRTFRFAPDVIEILESLCKEKNMNQTALLEEMIRTYSPQYNSTAHQVAEEVKAHLDSQYLDTLKKAIARTRALDVNQQICLEMLNSIAAGQNVNKFLSTDKNPAIIYTESRKHLSSKIAAMKQSKDWKEGNR